MALPGCRWSAKGYDSFAADGAALIDTEPPALPLADSSTGSSGTSVGGATVRALIELALYVPHVVSLLVRIGPLSYTQKRSFYLVFDPGSEPTAPVKCSAQRRVPF